MLLADAVLVAGARGNRQRQPRAHRRLDAEVKTLSPEAIRYPAGACGYFCASGPIDISPDKALYSRAFEQRGRGKVVG